MESLAVYGERHLHLAENRCSRSPQSSHLWLKQELQKTNIPHAGVASLFFSFPASAFAIPKVIRRDSIPSEDSDEDVAEANYRSRLRRKRGRKRPWWSGYKPPSLEEKSEGKLEKAVEILENLWIIKVFKVFGFALPPIIISCLIAGGLKAFLMAFALAMGLSAVAYAFEKLFAASGLADSTILPEKKKASESKMKSSGIDKKESESEFGGWDRLNIVEVDELSLVTPNAVIVSRTRERNQVLVLICLLVTVLPFCSFLTS